MSGSRRRIELILKRLTRFFIHLILAILVGLFYMYFEKYAAVEVHSKGRTFEK